MKLSEAKVGDVLLLARDHYCNCCFIYNECLNWDAPENKLHQLTVKVLKKEPVHGDEGKYIYTLAYAEGDLLKTIGALAPVNNPDARSKYNKIFKTELGNIFCKTITAAPISNGNGIGFLLACIGAGAALAHVSSQSQAIKREATSHHTSS